MVFSRGTIACIAVILWLGSSTAQSFKGSNLLVPVTQQTVFGADTLRVLAIMCEFQSDNDATTVGPGKFDSIYTKEYGTSILDPLPHDSVHFASHLEFAANYFRKVSNGRLALKSTVLPLRFTLSKTMRNYSPPINSTDFKPVAEFAQEAWKTADSVLGGMQVSGYDLFIVFHAGVGRDVSLPGSLGNERDIPSIYMNLPAFKKYLGSSFNGISLRNGTVANTLVLPQTENREVASFGTKSLYQITINGLLVSGIASHLGLPDLFNTETGLSAIGKFGLMDGQAIFAYNGLFPPEPSAWEKIYLGWAEPLTVTQPGVKQIIARNAAAAGQGVIYKVPVNADEYYLLENRRRNVNGSGAVLTTRIRGTVLTKTFAKDTTGFYPYSVDSVDGVVTDVDEFDWALPGSGIVIWHIDEKIIREKLSTNTINTDKNRRGVDVEEADGVQDIGEQFTTIFGDVLTGEGTDQDFWFAGNPAKLYKNEFSGSTRPATTTNSGAKSLITFSDFSASADTMSFRVSFGSDAIYPVSRVPFYGKNVSAFEQVKIADSTYFVLAAADTLLVINRKGARLAAIPGFTAVYPAVLNVGSGFVVAGVKDSLLKYARFSPSLIPSVTSTNIGGIGSCVPVLVPNGSDINAYTGTTGGKVSMFSFAAGTVPVVPAAVYNTNSGHAVQKIVADSLGAVWIVAETTGFLKPAHAGEFSVFGPSGLLATLKGEFKDAAASAGSGGARFTVLLASDEVVVLKNGAVFSRFSGSLVAAASSVSFADLYADGNNYILISDGLKTAAYNLSGALAVGFPVSPPISDSSAGFTLYAADADNDGFSDLFGFTAEGAVYKISGGNGTKQASAFSAGSRFTAAPVIYKSGNALLLAGVSATGLAVWNLSASAGKVVWGSRYGTSWNGSAVPTASESGLTAKTSAAFKPYNYPNPVNSGITWFRGFAPAAAKVTVDIFDLSGDRVSTLSAEVPAGLDFEIPWNIGTVQSGIYLATVKAEGGFSGTAVVKVAVIK